MTHKLKLTGFIAAALITVFAFFAMAYGEISSHIDTQVNSYQNFTFFSATTTNATSTNLAGSGGWFNIAGAKKVEIIVSRGGRVQPNLGLSRFRIQVTNDAGTTWNDFNRLIGSDVSATATSSITINAATSTVVVALDLRTDTFQGIRCIVLETTDGEHTCSASANF
ncbi:hypothetical protein IVB45_02235 [Bradyrhizobium sp. 4]|uniref:hypothetical protein n=1 Tax=Bradyrhizobium sp. 4 TaxID=2782678 RepID=UPI001FFFE2D5|nr:hypothetical protein [Bradyrhizobium sp. 4]UPJ35853.1 hypothetical protein IVB45_02235 [Bradyrhizobium sp. 4]